MDSGEVDVVLSHTEVVTTGMLQRGRQKQLLDGKSIIADVAMADGRRSKAFVQIDEETKQVMYVPTPIIARNLKVLAEVMHFRYSRS